METCRCEPRGWASEHKLGRAPRELTEKAAALCCDLQAQASSLPGAAWLVGEGLSHTAPVTGLVILFYNSPQGTSLGAGAQPTPQPLQGGGWGLQGCARAIQPAAGQLHGQGNLLPAARVSTGFPGGGTKNISRSQSSVSPLPRQGQTKRGADSKATILLMRHHLSHRAGPSSPPTPSGSSGQYSWADTEPAPVAGHGVSRMVPVLLALLGRRTLSSGPQPSATQKGWARAQRPGPSAPRGWRQVHLDLQTGRASSQEAPGGAEG